MLEALVKGYTLQSNLPNGTHWDPNARSPSGHPRCTRNRRLTPNTSINNASREGLLNSLWLFNLLSNKGRQDRHHLGGTIPCPIGMRPHGVLIRGEAAGYTGAVQLINVITESTTPSVVPQRQTTRYISTFHLNFAHSIDSLLTELRAPACHSHNSIRQTVSCTSRF